MSKGLMLLLDSARGTYIPQNFAEEMDLDKFDGIDPKDIATLRNGRDDEWYWEAWDDVLNSATYTDEDGNVWRLHQDGDLWAYCDDLMTDEERADFFGTDC